MSSRIVAVAGGSGSGKTTLARKIQKALGVEKCTIVGQDSYYFDQSHKFDRDGGSVNFDHPSALEFTLLAKQLLELKAGKDIEVPVYEFATHKRLPKIEKVKNHEIVLVDGTLILSQSILLPIFDESIFLEVDEVTRFQRRLKRDVEERGRTPEGVHEQFYKQVKLMHDEFVEPSKIYASLLLSDRKIIVQKTSTNHFQKTLIEILKTVI